MTSNFWRSGLKDKIHNGGVLGGLLGLAIWQGANIYSWLVINVPSAWLKLGEFSLPIYLILAGVLVGLIVDKY